MEFTTVKLPFEHTHVSRVTEVETLYDEEEGMDKFVEESSDYKPSLLWKHIEMRAMDLMMDPCYALYVTLRNLIEKYKFQDHYLCNLRLYQPCGQQDYQLTRLSDGPFFIEKIKTFDFRNEELPRMLHMDNNTFTVIDDSFVLEVDVFCASVHNLRHLNELKRTYHINEPPAKKQKVSKKAKSMTMKTTV
jgi:hypothetical protein